VSKKQILILLSFQNLILFCLYFFLKIYFQPIAVVVPHHNFVAQKRLEYFQNIAIKRPFTKTVIIIGPNHFSPNQNNLIYSNRQWNLSNGTMDFNSEFEPSLAPLLSLENNLVKNDHAIFNLLPDIKSVWPDATVFPILIGQNYPVSKLENIISTISKNCKFDCLLVASVDFSHYLPSGLAEIHDLKSIKELNNQNLTEIPKLEVDSPQSLHVLTSFAKSKNAKKWYLFFNSNSGKLSNNSDVETTSYVMGSYQKSLFKNKPINTKTYLISKNINKTKSLSSLGSRFFYGTDYIDLNYSSKSSVQLPFDLPNNMVVIKTIDGAKTEYHFFPTEIKNSSTYLLRGQTKITSLNNFFNQINLPQNCWLHSKNEQFICRN
jgi:MEMO1 family protein